MVCRAAFGAAVRREAGLGLTPGQHGRLAILERGERHLLQLIRQFARVTVNPLLLVGRDVRAEYVRARAGQHRRCMRVGGTHGEAFIAQAGLFRQAGGDLFAQIGWHGKVVHGDQDRQALLIRANGQCLGEEVLVNALGLNSPRPVTAQPDWVVRRDVHLCRSDLVVCLIGGQRRRGAAEHEEGG